MTFIMKEAVTVIFKCKCLKLSQKDTLKKKLCGLSPQASYTDRATAAVGEVVPAFCG
jgi:hypothetical protein